jgi:hypothetical protein
MTSKMVSEYKNPNEGKVVWATNPNNPPCKEGHDHAFGADGLCWHCDCVNEAYDFGFYMGWLHGNK